MPTKKKEIKQKVENAEITELLSLIDKISETEDPDAEINEKCAQFPQTEAGMALRMKARYTNELRFWNGDWYWFTGKYWAKRPDKPLLYVRMASQAILEELRYVASADDDSDKAKAVRMSRVKFAKVFESFKAATAAINFCKSYMAYTAVVFEVHSPLLINFKNGTYDLETCELLEHNPGHNFLSVLPFNYNSEAVCPRWLGFLNDVFDGDQDLISFIRACIGCTVLGGQTDDEWMCWCSGEGLNGKSTFLETLAYAFGQLSTQIPNNLLLVKKYDGHPTEIAELYNIRFAMCTDVALNSKLDDGQFKRLCSTGLVTGRYMNKDFFDFPITWKLWMSANSLPTVVDFTKGMWRRVIVLPFNKQIAKADKQIKADLKSKDEIEGLWAWMISAAVEFLQNGMPPTPQVVVDAVNEWKGDEDWFANFVDEECVIDPCRKVRLKDLYEIYTIWAKDNHIMPVGRKAFSHRVQMDSYRKDESNHHVGAQFIGLGLRHLEATTSNSNL